MDKESLQKRISDLEKELEKRKKKRDRIASAAFSAVYLVIFYLFDKRPVELEDYFNLVFVSVVIGCMHHGINSAIYEDLLSKDKYEELKLRNLRKQLSEIEERELEEVMLQRRAERKNNQKKE